MRKIWLLIGEIALLTDVMKQTIVYMSDELTN